MCLDAQVNAGVLAHANHSKVEVVDQHLDKALVLVQDQLKVVAVLPQGLDKALDQALHKAVEDLLQDKVLDQVLVQLMPVMDLHLHKVLVLAQAQLM